MPNPDHAEGASAGLSRYREIIPDWIGLQETLRSPEPTGVRVRTGIAPTGALLRRLAAQGFELVAVPGLPSLFQVTAGPRSIAQTVEHWLGLFHIQQSVMALPALALAPSPGERVLDLCAAPGGKTTHLADLMDDQGPLIAVDPKEKRLRGLLANVYRLGHPNVLVIAADGRTLPTTALFDRVLVDAPCSAEGTLRRKGGRTPRRSPGFVAYVTSLQEALLRRAILLTRPGGVIVYSTCTFAPEENEAVLTRVLEDSPARIETIDLDIPHSPGLLAWDGVRFHDDLERAWRVYPHHLDSGGLFMVRLRRLRPVAPDLASPDPALGWSPTPAAFPGEDPHGATRRITEALPVLERWFALHAIPSNLRWIVRGDNIWAHTAESWPVPAWKPSNPPTAWRVVSFGIRALRHRAGHGETPSNRFLARWGRELGADRRIRLSTDELLQLLEGNRQSLPAERLRDGIHALEWEGMVLGRGIVGARGLTHEIPKALATRLHQVLSEGGNVDEREA